MFQKCWFFIGPKCALLKAFFDRAALKKTIAFSLWPARIEVQVKKDFDWFEGGVWNRPQKGRFGFFLILAEPNK